MMQPNEHIPSPPTARPALDSHDGCHGQAESSEPARAMSWPDDADAGATGRVAQSGDPAHVTRAPESGCHGQAESLEPARGVADSIDGVAASTAGVAHFRIQDLEPAHASPPAIDDGPHASPEAARHGTPPAIDDGPHASPKAARHGTLSGGGRTIALLNQKGGVGKTTTTVNLGAALALAEQRVLLVDLDPQAHLTLHLGIDEERIEHTIYDLLIDPAVTARQAVINARPFVDVILSEVDLAGAEPELARLPERQRILQRKLEPILGDYDVVLLDCPPSLGLMTLNALSAAREVYVPMQAHFLALQGVSKLLETVGLVCRSVNRDLRVTGIILCMHEHQTTLAKEIVADLEAFFEAARGTDAPWRDCRLFQPPIRRNIKLAEAPSFGQTIFDYSPWCKGAIDYRKLARSLVEMWHRVAPESVPQQPQRDAEPPPAPPVPMAPMAPPAVPAATIEAKPEPSVAIAMAIVDRAEPPCDPASTTAMPAPDDAPTVEVTLPAERPAERIGADHGP